MKDNVVDMWEPRENEKHPLNSGVFKAGFACGLFQEANNLLFVFPMNQWLGFLTQALLTELLLSEELFQSREVIRTRVHDKLNAASAL